MPPLRGILEFFRKKSYRTLTMATAGIISTGTIFYHFIEGLRWLDALYFSVITLTTVGYGDFSPQTDVGKIFTILYILSGIGIILGFINSIYQHRVTRLEKAKERRRKEK